MNLSFIETRFRRISTGVFFCFYFLFFIVLNRYILFFQEQSQFFRFNSNYFKEFLSVPGGLLEYSGAFLTQFFLFPVAGPLILTLAGFAVYSITVNIFRKHQLNGVLWSFVPVLILAALHSNYLYTIAYTLGMIISLAYFALYISIRNNRLRFFYLFCVWPLLYYISGGYALFSILLCLAHEVFYNDSRSRFLLIPLIILLAVLVPYLASQLIFYIKVTRAWTLFLPFFIKAPVRYILILMLVYYPLTLIVSKVWRSYFKKELPSPVWSLKKIIFGTSFMACMAVFILKFIHDRETNLLLGIDHCIQTSDWDGALKLSSAYTDTNRLVMYFTNLALYKTGQIGDRLFHYPQAGTSGLWLDWKRDGATAFFGGEIYYHLAYTNEANRWAFEAMVSKGPNPRSLKRLTLTNLINGNIILAEKYLRILNQSLFYRNWARHYIDLLSKPSLLEEDIEISGYREFLIRSDFFANTRNLNLQTLLLNHPENKMAYDYLAVSLLLDNNLEGFIRILKNLKYYGYTRMPVHFEEALIFYNAYNKSNFIPEGFSLNPVTIKKFKDFASIFVRYGNNPALREKELKRRYGNTYWYYIHKSKVI